jgi:hypothetical protein
MRQLDKLLRLLTSSLPVAIRKCCETKEQQWQQPQQGADVL